MLMVHGIATLPLAPGIDISDRQSVLAFCLSDDFSLRRNNHGAAAALCDDQPNEILRCPHPQGLHANIVVTNGSAAHGRKKNDVRARQCQAARCFRHHQIVADHQAGRAQVRGRKNWKFVSALSRPCL